MNAKTHWKKRADQKTMIESLTYATLMNACIKRKVNTGRYQLTFHWDSQLDLDNHAFVRKAVIDALSRYMLGGKDDNAYIGRIIEEFHDKGTVKVEMEERNDMPYPYLKKTREAETEEHKKSPVKRKVNKCSTLKQLPTTTASKAKKQKPSKKWQS